MRPDSSEIAKFMMVNVDVGHTYYAQKIEERGLWINRAFGTWDLSLISTVNAYYLKFVTWLKSVAAQNGIIL